MFPAQGPGSVHQRRPQSSTSSFGRLTTSRPCSNRRTVPPRPAVASGFLARLGALQQSVAWVGSARWCLSLLRDGRPLPLRRAPGATDQPAGVAGSQCREGGLRGADQQPPRDALLSLDFDFVLSVSLDDSFLGRGPGSGVVAKVVQPVAQVVQLELADQLLGGGAALPGAVAKDREARDKQDQTADRELQGTVRLQLRLEVQVSAGPKLQGLQCFAEMGAVVRAELVAEARGAESITPSFLRLPFVCIDIRMQTLYRACHL